MTINDDSEPYSFDFVAAAEIIAGWPDVHAGLLARHVPRADGRCRGCASSVRLAPHAPCSLRRLAELASTVRTNRPVRRTSTELSRGDRRDGAPRARANMVIDARPQQI